MDSSIYSMRPRDVLTVCVLALLALGAVMVQSASTSLNGAIVSAGPPPAGEPVDSKPARPVNVRAAASADGIDLSWSPDKDPAVVSYRVYRGPAAATPAAGAAKSAGASTATGTTTSAAATPPGTAGFELLDTLRKPLTRYHDTAVLKGEPAAYRVTAVDAGGAEGLPAALTVTRPGLWRWTPLASKHLVYVGLAVGLYLLVGRLDYRRLAPAGVSLARAPATWLFVAAAGLCVAVLVPGIGTSINGARRWIKLGPVQIQPSELAKWAAVLFVAYWLTRRSADVATATAGAADADLADGDDEADPLTYESNVALPVDPAGDRSFFRGFLPAVVPVGVLCLLVVIQDFGTAALIGACALTMLLAGRVKWWHAAVVLVPALFAAYWFVAHKEYRWRRIMAFRDPYASPQGEGYHMIQSLLSFTTGGVTGRGLGNGVQKLGYLPEDTTDFIFAVVCEELGLFGAMLVVALYLGVMWMAWETVRRARRDFGALLAFGVASMVGLQAAINIAVATVSVPTKGLSLPLISAGGSGMVITCAALGLLYGVARVEDTGEEDEDAEVGQGVGESDDADEEGEAIEGVAPIAVA